MLRGLAMMKHPIAIVLLVVPAAAFAFSPVETAAVPTLGEAALLSMAVILPAAGVLALRRARRRS